MGQAQQLSNGLCIYHDGFADTIRTYRLSTHCNELFILNSQIFMRYHTMGLLIHAHQLGCTMVLVSSVPGFRRCHVRVPELARQEDLQMCIGMRVIGRNPSRSTFLNAKRTERRQSRFVND